MMKEEKQLFCAITFHPFKSKLYERVLKTSKILLITWVELRVKRNEEDGVENLSTMKL